MGGKIIINNENEWGQKSSELHPQYERASVSVVISYVAWNGGSQNEVLICSATITFLLS